MSGFAGAPAFGQALSHATGQPRSSSPFGATSSTTTTLFSNQPASSGFSSFAQPQISSAFGSPSAPISNGLGSTTANSGGSFAGFNTNKDAAMNNPFAAANPAPAGAAPNPFGTPSQTTPFGSPASPSANTSNLFGAPASTSPFASLQSGASAPAFGQPSQQAIASASPFGQPTQQISNAASLFAQPSQQSNNAPSPFAAPANSVQKRKNAFENQPDSKRPGTTFATNAFQKPEASANSLSALGANGVSKFGSNGTAGQQNKSLSQAASRKKSPSVYAKEIHDQLRKDNLKPPAWPKNPGNPDNLSAMDEHRIKYKAYEGKVRASLIKAGLIDDPDVRKKLSDAIDFRGICEEMCPEGEKVSRIVERDVKQPERFRGDSVREGWANTDLMVTTFKRSAAGIDAPLPMDVRSPPTLRRTLNYLIDDLLQGDENLPFMHGFLWDRTRAIRKDFIFQNAMTPEERLDQIYCLENITRFHAASLHLLCKAGKADFSEQQEREQLGKTLLSLMQVYDECKNMGISMQNEAEFRAYYLLFNAHDPFVVQQMQDWPDKFWLESAEIQTAISLVHVMQNVWNYRGPMKPYAPLTIGSSSYSSYFSIVDQPQVSYTMACMAEIHFTEIRRLILKTLHKSYARVRDGPKDLTAKALNAMFRFDTEEECVQYLKDYDMEFSTEGATEPYMVVVRRRSIPQKTVNQSSSQIVERKRGRHSFPNVVHMTVFEEASSAVDRVDNRNDSPDGLFVTQLDTPMANEQKVGPVDVNLTDDESPSASPAPSKQSVAPPPTAFSSGFAFPQQSTIPTSNAPIKNPFFPQMSSATTTAPAVTEQPSDTATPAPFPWTSSTSNNPFPPSSASEQPKQAMPTFSWAPNSEAAPVPATQGSGGVFDFLKRPSEQSQAPLFPTAGPKPSTASSLFPTIAPTGDKHQASETTSAMPTTTASSMFNPPQEASTAPTSIFTAPATSGPSSTPFSFTSAAPVPGPSLFPAYNTSNLPEPSTTPSVSPVPATAVLPSAAPAAKPPAPPKDLMGDFAKWILLGDYGMMEQLEEKILEDLVRDTYDNFQAEARARKQREADRKALTEALEYRAYKLSYKYLHLWKHNARRRFARNAAKKNKVKLKEWREEKAAEARAARIKRDREDKARQKRLTAPTSWLEELDRERSVKRMRRESMSLDTSRRSSPMSDADALMATGIFDGLPNQQQFAANAVRDDDSLYDALVGVQISPSATRQIMGPPAKPAKDPLRSVRDGGISKEPPQRKWSKKALAIKDLLSGKKKDEELLSFRGSTSSRLGQSPRSVPGGKVTNFSKYQSSSPRSSADPDRARKGSSSGIKSSYWLLRSHGLFATPTGHVLSDRAPRPRTGSNASQYSLDSEAVDFDDRILEQDGAYRASLGLTGGQSRPTSRRSTFSLGAAGSPPRSSLMKPKPSSLRQSLPTGVTAASLLESRSQRAEADNVSQAGSAAQAAQESAEELIRELHKATAELDNDTGWYREQNGRMSQGPHVGG